MDNEICPTDIVLVEREPYDVRGNKRLIPSKTLEMNSNYLGFADYEKKLRANGVILRPSERREKIERELTVLAKKGGYPPSAPTTYFALTIRVSPDRVPLAVTLTPEESCSRDTISVLNSSLNLGLSLQ